MYLIFCWFLIFKHEDLLLFCLIYDRKWQVFGFYTVGGTKRQSNLKTFLWALGDLMSILHTFHRPNNSSWKLKADELIMKITESPIRLHLYSWIRIWCLYLTICSDTLNRVWQHAIQAQQWFQSLWIYCPQILSNKLRGILIIPTLASSVLFSSSM